MFGALLVGLAAVADAHPSRGIVVTADGSVYFSDLERLWMIRPDGRLVRRREARGVHNHALAIGPGGEVCGEDTAYDPADLSYRVSLWSLAADGRFRTLYGPTRAPVRGVGIQRDRLGCTYHADQVGPARRSLVHRRCPDGSIVRLIGSGADDRAFTPVLLGDVAGSAVARDGSFIFRHGGNVSRVAPSGLVKTVAAGLARENFGMALDRDGSLLVAEAAARRIVRIAAGGRRSAAATSVKPWFPTGVAAGRGALYVLEATDYVRGTLARMRVRRVSPTGASRTLATVTIPSA